jgi:hypothetical protein
MPDPTPPLHHAETLEPSENLADRLDAFGRALASREPTEPPAALIDSVRARRTRPRVLRLSLLAAALIALACGAFYLAMREPVAPDPEPIAHRRPPRSPTLIAHSQAWPTLATLRRLNPDPAPEALRFPTITTTAGPSIPARPADAFDANALARIAGPTR